MFALFADEKALNIICYLYSLPHMPVAASLICKHTGYNYIEVEKYMTRLCDNHLVIRTAIATADGEMSSYSVRPEGFAVPLLCFADEIAKNNPRPFFGAPIVGAVTENYACRYCGRIITGVIRKQ